MSMYEDHVSYVTREARRWLDGEESDFVAAKLAYIAEQNADAGNDPTVSRDDDAEWLAGELEDHAVSVLVLPAQPAFARALLCDALSETDWANIALGYLPSERERGDGK